MFSSRFAEPAVPAGMLGLAALLAAGTANAETADDRFLGTVAAGHRLRQYAVSHHRRPPRVRRPRPGHGAQRHQQQHRSANARIDRQTALVTVVDAAQSYCPQYVHPMANGATVIGPDH